MRQINYPKGKELEIFEKKFLEALNSERDQINEYLTDLKAPDGSKLTFEKLILMPLSDLIEAESSLTKILKKYNVPKPLKDDKKIEYDNAFLDLFDYKSNHDRMAVVFRNAKAFKSKTCYYCGIDYINGFRDFGDYRGPLDFLNNADMDDLTFVYGIGKKTAMEIISARNARKIKSIDTVKFKAPLRKYLLEFDFQNNYDHFTLDHLLPQKTYGFFSLCLYNLVPSCYGCNSKFKNSKDFGPDKNLLKISPTSPSYTLTDDFKFKIHYNGNLRDIANSSDFVLRLNLLRNFKEVNTYDKIFKVTGRYIAHKDELLDLIKKRVNNPDCVIKNRAQLLKISPQQFKELIYGKEIFDKDSSKPMHKFKRDIAENIKIIT